MNIVSVRRSSGLCFFFFKQKTAYEMRISDWSSDVCSSDLLPGQPGAHLIAQPVRIERFEHFGEQFGGAAGDTRGIVAIAANRLRRRYEKIANRVGDVHALHPPRHHRRGEEILAQELRHGSRNPVLVLRNDRGVRNGNAEGMAEQRGDREPVRSEEPRVGKEWVRTCRSRWSPSPSPK